MKRMKGHRTMCGLLTQGESIFIETVSKVNGKCYECMRRVMIYSK